MKKSVKLMTIAEISEMSGVSVRTLRDRIARVKRHEGITYPGTPSSRQGDPRKFWVTYQFMNDIVRGGKARQYSKDALNKVNSRKSESKDGTNNLSIGVTSIKASAEDEDVKLCMTFPKTDIAKLVEFLHSFKDK